MLYANYWCIIYQFLLTGIVFRLICNLRCFFSVFFWCVKYYFFFYIIYDSDHHFICYVCLFSILTVDLC